MATHAKQKAMTRHKRSGQLVSMDVLQPKIKQIDKQLPLAHTMGSRTQSCEFRTSSALRFLHPFEIGVGRLMRSYDICKSAHLTEVVPVLDNEESPSMPLFMPTA